MSKSEKGVRKVNFNLDDDDFNGIDNIKSHLPKMGIDPSNTAAVKKAIHEYSEYLNNEDDEEQKNLDIIKKHLPEIGIKPDNSSAMKRAVYVYAKLLSTGIKEGEEF